METPPRRSSSDSFAVVCIAGSAGGLEGYIEILERLPSNTGMAFVIVSHRGTESTLLRPLLSNKTRMQVVEVTDRMRLAPNRVFLGPPHLEMTTDGLFLRLREPSKPKGWPILVSVFLRSLATTCASRAIAVILSGNGFDGSDALRAVKDAGGVTFAQSDALWQSMPRQAVSTGNVDFELTVEEIAKRLVRIGRTRTAPGEKADG
jgi:chemotaxis response regulator CheB